MVLTVSRKQRTRFDTVFAFLGILGYFLSPPPNFPKNSVIDLQFSETLTLNNWLYNKEQILVDFNQFCPLRSGQSRVILSFPQLELNVVVTYITVFRNNCLIPVKPDPKKKIVPEKLNFQKLRLPGSLA